MTSESSVSLYAQLVHVTEIPSVNEGISVSKNVCKVS